MENVKEMGKEDKSFSSTQASAKRERRDEKVSSHTLRSACIIELMEVSSKQDIDLITKAFDFAQLAYQGQKRFSGEPYLVHCVQTAKTLADLGMSSTVISAGLLHDCLEDANVTENALGEEFGEEILFLVKGVTKLGKLKYRGVQRHKESLRKLFVAVSQDIRVIIIKLADRLHNMQTLEYVPEHKRLRIAVETLEIYVSIAYRLGIRKFSRQLEDLAFPFVYPKEYKKTKDLLKTKSKEQLHNLDKFQKSIKKALAKKGIIKFNVHYRIKTFYSLYKKLKKKDWNIEKIYDISALRIIVSDIEECYKVFGIIHGIWRYLPGKIKDYISFPKPNNYQALHTTVFTGYGNVVEIQIKTKEMHQVAEYGIASHILYKENTKKEKLNNYFSWIKHLLPTRAPSPGGGGETSQMKTLFSSSKKQNEIISNTRAERSEAKRGRRDKVSSLARTLDIPTWIKELVEYQRINSNEEGLEEDIKNDFFQQRIFVFTPRGDVVDLPIDSSPVDFAYAIHSDIGNHIAGAKVNGKMVSLEGGLVNGDIVEILTKKNAKPNRKWLAFVKTTAARKNIKAFLSRI